VNGSSQPSAYGLWSLVIINTLVFAVFAFSFYQPKTRRDWRSLGAFIAFLLALFTEMYGFPLTIYLLSGWLTTRLPGIDWFSHDAGHLPEMLFGWRGEPHFGPFHLASNALILGGFVLLASAWRVLHAAQQRDGLATTGPYEHIRHPQYAAFILIVTGFLLQWPTILTLAMYPILVYMYVRLARREEADAMTRFGDTYRAYMAATPAYFPRLSRPGHRGAIQ
jgi:protein-S-isoprenylcysteine O-methyltransferase Ste14